MAKREHLVARDQTLVIEIGEKEIKEQIKQNKILELTISLIRRNPKVLVEP